MKSNIPVLLSFSSNDGLKLLLQQSSGISLINLLTQRFKSMKKILLCLAIVATLLFVLTSCAATKRDCQGNKHYKQKGGFYM